MAIFRCSKCGHIREVGGGYIGKSVKCPECAQISPVHDTIVFLKALIKKYITQNKELHRLQQELSNTNSDEHVTENILFEEIDIHNTNILTKTNNLEPISRWFEKRKIKINFNYDASDTTGFYDEIALKLGSNFDILCYVSNQIKYGQNKNFSNIKIDLCKKTQKEADLIKSFCEELYDYSFVAKYLYQKKDKVVRLTLQTAPQIREFFNGLWMEWFVLIKLLYFFRSRKIAPACTRSLELSFNGGNSNELDLFVLSENNIPICVECKTGEFRQYIDKYLSLRKQLDVTKNQFVVCVFGLSNEQAVGMTSMYDLTFVNEMSFMNHIENVICL